MRRQPWLLALVAALGIALPTFAQWPSSPDTNFVICNHTSEQSVPKIAATSNGGCYISWYDLASGNYDVYLQRLDVNGVEQWAHNGLLISNHPQNSWITDWDLTVDGEDHAILTVNDVRAGGDWDIYAYRISPAGAFVWGPDGVVISNNANEEYVPRACVTSSGNVVIAWQEEAANLVIHLRKLTPAGADVWSPPVITITATNGVSVPRLAATSDSDGVILEYFVHGTGLSRNIYTQRFDSLGTMLWGNGIVITNAGGVTPWMLPNIVPDGEDGIYCCWYDGRTSNQLHVYVQHITAAGTPQWTANGVRVSLSSTENQSEPAFTVVPGPGSVLVFYMTSNFGQTAWGLGGQALNTAGALQWGNNGITYVALSDQQPSAINAGPFEGLAASFVSYLEMLPGSANDLVKAFAVDYVGNIWPASITTLSSVVSDKLDMVSAVNTAGQFLSVWCDHRSDAGDIYLQNINPDGTLGPFGNQPPLPFSLISPADHDTTYNELVVFAWQPTVDPDAPDSIMVYDLVIENWYHTVRVAGLSDTTDSLTWWEILYPSEHDWVTSTWWVEAISQGDTTHSTETWEFILPPQEAADDPSAIMPTSFALYPAYPNPFNSTTTIRVDLPATGPVTMTVFDLNGRQITEVISHQVMSAGTHTIRFDGSDLSSGIYFVSLTTPQAVQTRKLVLLK